MRSAKIPIPAASRRGITEFSLRDALPLVVNAASGRGIRPVEIELSPSTPVVRYRAAAALGNLGKRDEAVLPVLVQWLEQSTPDDSAGYVINALWSIVVGE